MANKFQGLQVLQQAYDKGTIQKALSELGKVVEGGMNAISDAFHLDNDIVDRLDKEFNSIVKGFETKVSRYQVDVFKGLFNAEGSKEEVDKVFDIFEKKMKALEKLSNDKNFNAILPSFNSDKLYEVIEIQAKIIENETKIAELRGKKGQDNKTRKDTLQVELENYIDQRNVLMGLKSDYDKFKISLDEAEKKIKSLSKSTKLENIRFTGKIFEKADLRNLKELFGYMIAFEEQGGKLEELFAKMPQGQGFENIFNMFNGKDLGEYRIQLENYIETARMAVQTWKELGTVTGNGSGNGTGNGTGAGTGFANSEESAQQLLEVLSKINEVLDQLNLKIENLGNSSENNFAKQLLEEKEDVEESFSAMAQSIQYELQQAFKDFANNLQNIDDRDWNFTSLRESLLKIVDEFKNSLAAVNLTSTQLDDAYKMLKGWNDADFYSKTKAKIQNRERGALINSETGYTSNPYFFDDLDSFSGKLYDAMADLTKGLGSMGELFDTFVHSHPIRNTVNDNDKTIAATGIDIGFSYEDLSLAINKFFKSGVTKMLLTSGYKYSKLDLSDLDENTVKKLRGHYADRLEAAGLIPRGNGQGFTIPSSLVTNDKGKFDFNKSSEILNNALIGALKDAGIETSRFETGNIEDLKIDMTEFKKKEEEASSEAYQLLEVLNKIADALTDINKNGFKFAQAEASTGDLDTLQKELDETKAKLEQVSNEAKDLKQQLDSIGDSSKQQSPTVVDPNGNKNDPKEVPLTPDASSFKKDAEDKLKDIQLEKEVTLKPILSDDFKSGLNSENSTDSKIEEQNKELEHQQFLYNNIIKNLTEYLSLQDKIKSGNKSIVDDTYGSYINPSDIRKQTGKVSKSSINKELQNYLGMLANSDLYSESNINYQKEKLAAYVANLNDANAASEIFGNKNKELFAEITQMINNATIAQEAYNEAQLDLKAAKSNIFDLSEKQTWTLGQSDEFEKILETEGIETALGYVVDLLGFKIPEAADKTKESLQKIDDELKDDQNGNKLFAIEVVPDINEETWLNLINEALSSIRSKVKKIELDADIDKLINNISTAINNMAVQTIKVDTSFNDNQDSKNVQKVMYHYGLLSSYQGGKKSHQFGDEITAYKEGKSNGGRGWADGTGTYVTNDVTEFDKITPTEDFKKFFALDATKLKMYEAHIEEEAQKFYEFQHKLEQFVLAFGSGYTGFDDNISDITSESLYVEAKSVFAKYPEIFNLVFKDFEDFNAFIDKMINLVSESGMNENGFEPKNAIKFMEFKKNNGVDDIKTRFLKELGFQGIDLSGTSYGGIQSGSVIFDIDTAPIIASGKTIEEVLDAIGIKAEDTKYKIQEVTKIKSNSPLKNDSDTWSTSGSIISLADENDKFEKITTSAKDAANSKEEFVNANKEVKASAESSSTSLDDEKKKIENVGGSAEETKKKLDDVVFKPNTKGFDEIVSKLDIAKDKIEEISKITKSSVWSKSQGEYIESYNIKYKNGTSEIRGESSNKKGSNVLRANEVAYDATDYNKSKKKSAEESYAASNKYLKEQYDLLNKIAKAREDNSKTQNTDIPLWKEKIQQLQALIDKEDEYRKENDLVDSVREASFENANLRMSEQYLANREAYNNYIEKTIDLLHEQAIAENAVFDKKNKDEASERYKKEQEIKAQQKRNKEEQQFIDAMAKGREQSEKSRQAEEKRQQLAQDSAINKALEQEFQERQNNIKASEKQNELDRQKAINFTKSASNKLSSAISQYSYGDSSDATAMMKQMNRGLSNFGDLSDIQGDINKFNLIIDQIIADLKVSHEESLKAINEEIAAEENKQKQKDSFNKKNLNAIDLEIQKREEESKMFSSMLKEQMENREKQISSFQSDIDGFNVKLESFKIKPDDGHAFETWKQKIQELNTAINQYKEYVESIKSNGGIVSNEDEKKLEEMKSNIESLIRTMSKTSAGDRGWTDISATKTAEKINNVLKENSAMSKQAKAQIRAYYNEITSGNPSKPLNEILDSVYKIVQAEREAGREGKNFIDIIKDKTLYGLAAQIGTMFGFYDLINYLRTGIGTVREFDTALTEMRKVSDETIDSLKDYQLITFDIGDTVGATAKTIQDSTADWMRLGESLEDAAESAKTANILLNVSEFDNIDDATKSLVSMSQAYNELEKIDIVNKLNNIGNNYSIATNELATGLQNAAAVLKTQGNDLDKAIALITAGNAITQDADKTSSGIRTIALRIAGTEEAKEELQQMGEEVDDFIVKTNSKTQKIIKDYTAVASNAYQGIDVLDANGNLRDTYDILLDIARIYKEIQKEDKKAGTNRANALVEELAGKNRSNIASSILLNPDLLENVYKSSKNSDNSAQVELDKYLDSIDGKLLQLENRAQEFWVTFINSDALKNGITLLTQLIQLATTLIDKLGTIPTILGSIGIVGFVKNFA